MNIYTKNIDRIEFVVTMSCTGRCRHCSEGEHDLRGGHIDGNIAARAVEEVCGDYNIKSLMTFGGEPLLYADDVCMIHEAAKNAGIPRREVITNGFFSRDERRIAEVAERLSQSGVNRIMLSVDAFHQESIPIGYVELFAKCVRNVGVFVEMHPAWLISKEDDNPYNLRTIELLKSFSENGFEVSEGNIIFPSGNALKYLGEYFTDQVQINPYADDPRDIRALCFEPDGSVLNGNINNSPIMEIIDSYIPE